MNVTSHEDEHSFDSYVERIMFGEHLAVISKVILDGAGGVAGLEPEVSRKRKERSTKATFTHEDRVKSPFFVNYILPAAEEDSPLRKEGSKMGKKFRRRFRVPYQIFLDICVSIREIGEYRDGMDASGDPKVPLELLVLACLRYLGSGCPFDLLEELTSVDEETIRVYFHRHFCIWGVHAAEEVIKLPCDEESLQHVMGLYELLGLPGCTGSVDCVHVVWDKCRAGLQNVCKGKEDHPTLVFEVVASHTRRILSVSQFFWGATNDKSIARMDEGIGKLRAADSFFAKVKWSSFDEIGNCIGNQGAYYICDGGYHDWECMMAPFKYQMEMCGVNEERCGMRVWDFEEEVSSSQASGSVARAGTDSECICHLLCFAQSSFGL